MTEQNEKPEKSQFEFTIGGYLKHKREIAGKSLETLSLKTKINISMLETLEKDDFQSLPDKAYVRGYIKSYIKELHLDFEETMSILEWTYQSMQKSDNVQVEPPKGPVKLSIPLLAGGAVITLLLTVSLIYLFSDSTPTEKKVAEVVTPSEQLITEATPTISAEKVIPTIIAKSIEPAAIKTPTSTPTSIATPIALKTPIATPTPVAQKENENKDKDKVKVEFSSSATPLFAYFEQNIQDENQSILPNKYKNAAPDSSEKIFIAAHLGSTWLTYKKDNDPIKKVLLEQGQNLFISGNEIRLFFGNINVAKVFHNNKLINPSSRSGVKSLVFPTSSQAKYKIPLFVFNKDKSEVITSDEYIAKYPEESN